MDHNTKCALAHPAPGTNTLPQIDISGHNQNSNCPQIIKSSRAVTKVLLILLGNAAFCKAFLEKSLFFIFRFACVQKKNVPRHILAPSAVACDNLHLRASAHLRHAVPFCFTGSSIGISCETKSPSHSCPHTRISGHTAEVRGEFVFTRTTSQSPRLRETLSTVAITRGNSRSVFSLV